jgi:hypothetical protein
MPNVEPIGALALRELEHAAENMLPGPNRDYWEAVRDDVRALAALAKVQS